MNLHSPYLEWNLDEGFNNEFFQRMEIDIVLKFGTESLIIDTKFYNNPMIDRYKLYLSNLYQIYSYVKNYDTEHTGHKGHISGILLFHNNQ